MGDAGDMLLIRWVAFNKAIGGGQFPEPLADALIGERRTDKVYLWLTQAQVNNPVWCSLCPGIATNFAVNSGPFSWSDSS